MDTGNSLSYEEYTDICHELGIYTKWEIDLGWSFYLSQIDDPSIENYNKQINKVYWNAKIYAEGRFN